MGAYAEGIANYLSKMGKPITTTSTTEAEGPSEGLDLSSLLMMLMFSGAFGGAKTTGLGMTELPANQAGALNQALQTQVSGPGALAPSSLSGMNYGNNLATILGLLSSLGR